jgi:hypothetical protein
MNIMIDFDRQSLVSVIIPVRNGAATIGRAIRSILCQTYRRYEIIVLDDVFYESDNNVRSDDDKMDRALRLMLTKWREIQSRSKSRFNTSLTRCFNGGSIKPQSDTTATGEAT